MSTALPFTIYDPEHGHVGSARFAEDAAAMVSLGVGRVVSWRHGRVIWREGEERVSAGESYDEAAAIMYDRIEGDD